MEKVIAIPPHNNEAEESVIGSILMDSKQINPLTLESSDFSCEALGIIYAACKKVADKNIGIDQITVAQTLEEQGQLAKIGGVSYLSQLIANCASPLDCYYHAQIVKKLAISRNIISVSQQINKIGFNPSEDINADLNKADDLLMALRKKGASSPILEPDNRMAKAIERLNTLHDQVDGVAISTGLRDLDYQIGGGLYAGDMAIVAARPSMGKTAMMMAISNHVGLGKNVLICSAEMTPDSITDRDLAGAIGITTNEVRRGGFSDDLWVKLIGDGVAELGKRKVYLYYDPPLTTAKIMQAGINMQLRHGLGMIAVDYLGLLDDEYGKSQVDRLGYISRKLKLIAQKLNVPLLLLCQLNRALEGRDDKRPELFDLRESGHIEEDADLVMFLYRDDYYFTPEEWISKKKDGVYPKNITEILIAKQRQGQANKQIKVYFDEVHQKYCDLAREE